MRPELNEIRHVGGEAGRRGGEQVQEHADRRLAYGDLRHDHRVELDLVPRAAGPDVRPVREAERGQLIEADPGRLLQHLRRRSARGKLREAAAVAHPQEAVPAEKVPVVVAVVEQVVRDHLHGQRFRSEAEPRLVIAALLPQRVGCQVDQQHGSALGIDILQVGDQRRVGGGGGCGRDQDQLDGAQHDLAGEEPAALPVATARVRSHDVQETLPGREGRRW
jgi:hypothetical protein